MRPEHEQLVFAIAHDYVRKHRLRQIPPAELVGFAWQGLRRAERSWKGIGVFEGWAAKLIRHEIAGGIRDLLNYRRARARAPGLERLTPATKAPVARDDPAELVELSDEASEILAALPERLAQVLRMRYLEGKRLTEVGRALGIGESRACQLERKAIAFARATAS